MPLRMHAYAHLALVILQRLITVAAHCKARSVFYHLHMGFTDSNLNPHGFIVHLEQCSKKQKKMLWLCLESEVAFSKTTSVADLLPQDKLLFASLASLQALINTTSDLFNCVTVWKPKLVLTQCNSDFVSLHISYVFGSYTCFYIHVYRTKLETVPTSPVWKPKPLLNIA